jgi:hypothetical protein
VTRFTVAWDVGNGGKASKFSASLGSFVPTGEEMWMPVPKMIRCRFDETVAAENYGSNLFWSNIHKYELVT